MRVSFASALDLYVAINGHLGARPGDVELAALQPQARHGARSPRHERLIQSERLARVKIGQDLIAGDDIRQAAGRKSQPPVELSA